MEKEILDQQVKVEYDNYGNAIINGKRYLSEESHNHFTQSLQNQNNDLLTKFDTLSNEFNAFRTQVNNEKRNDILLKAGIREDQLNNVSKLMSDIPTEDLIKTLENDRSLDIFRSSKFKQQEQQQEPKNEEPKEISPVEKAFDLFN